MNLSKINDYLSALWWARYLMTIVVCAAGLWGMRAKPEIAPVFMALFLPLVILWAFEPVNQ